MKVILLQKVTGLGDIDEVREVAEGYARNFLFPRHLAVQASPSALQTLEAKQRREAKVAERELQDQQALADRVDGRGVELVEKANQKGQLYAAVSAQRLSEALQKMGFAVDRKQLIMKPLKQIGAHRVAIKFSHGLEAEITVIITAI